MVRDETVIRVRYKDTDQMGVVYHANYLVWFEVGRTELMRRLGMPYLEFEKNNLYLPVIKVSCDFKVPARYDDQVKVITWIENLQDVRLFFHYEIRRDKELLARGMTEHAFVNNQGHPVVLRKYSPFLWGRLYKAVEG
ncbi:MAG: thioesterase family protein [Bacillota bacterium]